LPVYASELPRFREECRRLSRRLGVRVDPDVIADLVTGEGQLGFLIAGSVDLDNADNVSRSSLYLGLDVDRGLPVRVSEWLARRDPAGVASEAREDPTIAAWRAQREELYRVFFDASPEEIGRQAFLEHLIRRAIQEGLPRRRVVWS